jgi:hypothetical protein
VARAVNRVEIVPIVDGRSFWDVVHEFERSRAFVPAGAYSGLLVTDRPNVLTQRFGVDTDGRTLILLGCECGESGCWPLECCAVDDGEVVAWSRFRQPHRPAWDYSGLGPFTFARDAYSAALADPSATLGT